MQMILFLVLIIVAVACIIVQYVRSRKTDRMFADASEILASYENGLAFSDKQTERLNEIVEQQIEKFKQQYLLGIESGTVPVPPQVIAAIEVKKSEFSQELQETRVQNVQLSTDNKELRQKVAQLVAIGQQLEAANAELRGALTTLQSDTSESEKISSLMEQLELARTRTGTLERENAELRQANRQLEEELTEAQSQAQETAGAKAQAWGAQTAQQAAMTGARTEDETSDFAETETETAEERAAETKAEETLPVQASSLGASMLSTVALEDYAESTEAPQEAENTIEEPEVGVDMTTAEEVPGEMEAGVQAQPQGEQEQETEQPKEQGPSDYPPIGESVSLPDEETIPAPESDSLSAKLHYRKIVARQSSDTPLSVDEYIWMRKFEKAHPDVAKEV